MLRPSPPDLPSALRRAVAPGEPISAGTPHRPPLGSPASSPAWARSAICRRDGKARAKLAQGPWGRTGITLTLTLTLVSR